MITIYYHTDPNKIRSWKERLDQLFFKYNFIEQAESIIPRLVDGEKQVEGIPAIETYLDSLEVLVKGWYEDRCDRHDFDPDA